MKKALSVLLALGCAVSLAACGSSSGSSSGSSDTTAAQAADNGDTAEATEAAASSGGSDEDSIVIGLYGTITGTNAIAGDMLQKGAQIAVQEVNESGGINGKTLELVVYDDKSSPEGAVKAVTRMVEVDNVVAICASNLSPNILATVDITEDAKVLQVGAGTSTAYCNAGYSYLFRGTASAALPNAAFVAAMSDMGAEKVAIVSIASENGVSGVASTKELMGDKFEIVCEEQYQPTDTDFTGQIAKVLASGADSVVLYGTTADSALVIKQLRSSGYDGYIYGPEALGVPDIINVAGDAANGVIFGSGAIIPSSVEEAASDVEKAFLESYVSIYGVLPLSDVVYRGYDSAWLIATALRNAEDYTNPESLREAFISITDFEGIAGTYDFSDESGEGVASARSFIVDGGKNVLFETWLANQ